jgi:hypothetical protein
MPDVSYRRHRFPPEAIRRAVWLYFRFPLSFRLADAQTAHETGLCSEELGDRQVAGDVLLSAGKVTLSQIAGTESSEGAPKYGQ